MISIPNWIPKKKSKIAKSVKPIWQAFSATQVAQPQKCIQRTFSLALRSSGTSFRIIGQKFILVWRALSNCYTLLPNLHLIFSFFCLHSWPHKWTKNSRNNSPPEKSWKSFHRPENGNVWIMLLGLFRDSSRYTLRKFTILYLFDHFCTLETIRN